MSKIKSEVINFECFSDKGLAIEVKTMRNKDGYIFYFVLISVKNKKGEWYHQRFFVSDLAVRPLYSLLHKSSLFSCSLPRRKKIVSNVKGSVNIVSSVGIV